MTKRYTDTEIVAAIKAGNADRQLQFLYDTTQHKIRSYVLNNNGSASEAQDVFQDAVVAFFQHVLAGKFEDGKSVDGFIYTVARNSWINRAKKASKMVRQTPAAENSNAMADTDHYLNRKVTEERAQNVQDLLATLGERCKELLTYTVFYKLRMDEVAEKMGFSNANAAKTQNYKCKQKLIRTLKENSNLKAMLYK